MTKCLRQSPEHRNSLEPTLLVRCPGCRKSLSCPNRAFPGCLGKLAVLTVCWFESRFKPLMRACLTIELIRWVVNS